MSEFIDVLRMFSAGKAVEYSRLTDAVKWAIEQFENHGKVRKVDNGDGTVTWHGIPVVVADDFVPEGEIPAEIRSLLLGSVGRHIINAGEVAENGVLHTELKRSAQLWMRVAPKPEPVTWLTPASLPDGEYRWDGESFEPKTGMWSANKHLTLPLLFADWTDPPREGRYRKVGRTATWIGK